MNTLANSYAVSPSGGDFRGDGLVPRTSRTPQDRFADIPILAGVNGQARSDSNSDAGGDLGGGVQREQDTPSARERDRSTAESTPIAVGVAASDNPPEPPVQARSGTERGDVASARLSETTAEGAMPVGQPGAEQKKKSAIFGQYGNNGQYAQVGSGIAGKYRGSGTPASGPSALKENLQAAAHILDGRSAKALMRKQNPLAASSKSEARLQKLGVENQSRAGFKRGGGSGNLDAATEALLSRGRESQASGHKGGAHAPTGSAACFANQPAAAGPHDSVGTAAFGSVDGGAGESVSQSVGDQILDSLKASAAQGDRQVFIRLQPPELGMVTVQFREQGEGLDGTLKVERADTRREIEQALPEVVRCLQDAGIGIRRLEVTDRDSPGQDVGGGQPQQDGSSGHHDAGQDPGRLWASSTPWSPAGTDSSVSIHQAPDIQGPAALPHGRIDMLL